MSGETALALVTDAKSKGALVFANMEHLEAQVELYRTEVTVLTFAESEFHTINGKKMPNKAATDRIGEACGIQFIQSACRVVAETHDDAVCGGRHTVYRAEAQGKVRMPDGSWRTSTVDEYEFDPILRAMLDKNVTELNDQTRKIVSRLILDYTKVARQRAATGARLRVIRQLTGMSAAFEPDEAKKPMVFTRIVQNTSYILETPEGRIMATAQALGADVTQLFGGRSKALEAAAEEPQYKPADKVDPECTTTEPENAADDEPEFPVDENETGEDTNEVSEMEQVTVEIEQYLSTYKDALNVKAKNNVNPYESGVKELNNNNATLESRRKMKNKIRDFLISKKIKGVV